MNRKTLDKMVSYLGLALAGLLVVAGYLAYTGYSFADTSVTEQLAQQNINFPTTDTAPVAGEGGFTQADIDALAPFIGTSLTTGDGAKAYADHYIAVHMAGIGGGKTYSEISGAYMAALASDPTAPETAALGQQRMTMFMGDTLRGLLLEGYAFWSIGQIALIASYACYVGAVVMFLLALFGFRHAKAVETA
ncbi:MAG: hypothetical protein NT032_06615 [Actinobacteria bacterium]|jgi:hypothetical protein|nr:hypothetical protein [Actinomycetota bacterium]